MHTFTEFFQKLTGNPPFPWQIALYHKFAAGEFPSSANIPTGLGKTSIVAIWLIALALHPSTTPRRLVYVVNRRTVVDQTTDEAKKLCDALARPELAEIRNKLAALCALPLPTPESPPLATSTLRGQFADNGEWCADPSRPAVIVGTVDMIGSGLLFSRYTRSFKTRPLHAGFLAQDVLLIHDEAHLEPAFQKLLERLATAQNIAGDLRPLRLIELTATSRNSEEEPLGLDENPTDKDSDNVTVRSRYHAFKRLELVPVTKIQDGKDKANDSTVRDKILELAVAKKDNGRAVLVFVRSVEVAEKIVGDLHKVKQAVVPLTGTMRGKERDGLVRDNLIFQRFLPPSSRSEDITPAAGTVFLVATSAGEVGVNLSADDLICDLTTYESMAQRFGRVNRFGENDDSEITVVFRANLQTDYDEGLAKAQADKKNPAKKVAAYNKKSQLVLRILKTLSLLEALDGSANSAALDALSAAERIAAFSPEPEQRVATEIQFDAWALTTVRQPIAARPPVAPYLHGGTEWQPPETHVAWRQELDVLGTAELRAAYPPAELLEDFPLKPHELLRDTTERVFDRIVSLLSKRQNNNEPIPDAWLIPAQGEVEVFPLSRLLSDQDAEDEDTVEEEDEEDESENASIDKNAEKARRNRLISHLADATLILPASLGGVDEKGLLTPDAVAPPDGRADVADIVAGDAPNKRQRVWSNSTNNVPDGFRLVRVIDKFIGEEDTRDSEDSPTVNRYWLWLEAKNSANGERRFSANMQPETLGAHTAAVTANASAIAEKLLPPDMGKLLVLAARLHDLGKNRAQWQRNLGNLDYDPDKPETILAKSMPGMRPRNLAEHYRHEFGSLKDAASNAEFAALTDAERDIVLHLVAAHHGRARPHFPDEEIHDQHPTASPEKSVTLATEIPRRFARLQKQFGRWGLAWLESLLRAADYAASAGITANGKTITTASTPAPRVSPTDTPQTLEPSATLSVNPANPGHYFACCGLFELASRLAPEALAWFEQTADGFQFHLTGTPALSDLLAKITAAEIKTLDEMDNHSAVEIALPLTLRLDWWRHENRATGKLKTWAGQMKASAILTTLQCSLRAALTSHNTDVLHFLSLEASPSEAVSYFDAPRSAASARDVGYSLDKLKKGGLLIQNMLHPAVELFTLIGLQRTRPALLPCAPRAEQTYAYHLWKCPLPISLLPIAAVGALPDCGAVQYHFSNPSRTKDYRAFIFSLAVSSS